MSEPGLESKASIKAKAKAQAKAQARAQAQAQAEAVKKQVRAAPPKPLPVPVGPFETPHEDEERTVHAVYEAIAPHFSQTRHKPWPLITAFLQSLPPNAVGLDSGAGNGKYVPVAHGAGAEMIALDRSAGLLGLAKEENGAECVRGDLGFTGWRNGVFDFAISVAAIHHLSTPERRCHSVQTLLRPLRLSATPPYSRFMIYVWAYEQGQGSKRRMGVLAPGASAAPRTDAASNSDEASTNAPAPESVAQADASSGQGPSSDNAQTKIQDVLVPWVYTKPGEPSKRKVAVQGNTNGGTATAPVSATGTGSVDAASSIGGPGAHAGAVNVEAGGAELEAEPQVFHRYYHLFVEGELRDLVLAAAEKEGFVVRPDVGSTSGAGAGAANDLEDTEVGDIERGVESLDVGSGGASEEADADNCRSGSGSGARWLRVRGVGWEADNWWLEGEVGLA